MKNDLKGHIRSSKAFYVYLFSSNNSSVKPTLPLMLPQIVCALLSPIPFCSLDVKKQINIKDDIKAMLWRGSAILKNVPIF